MQKYTAFQGYLWYKTENKRGKNGLGFFLSEHKMLFWEIFSEYFHFHKN